MMRKFFLSFILLLIIAVILVPKKEDYFQRLEDDLGEIHPSVILDEKLLKEMGGFNYQHRLIFSQFKYSFGDVSVSYYGFLNLILFKSSEQLEPQPRKITV